MWIAHNRRNEAKRWAQQILQKLQITKSNFTKVIIQTNGEVLDNQTLKIKWCKNEKQQKFCNVPVKINKNMFPSFVKFVKMWSKKYEKVWNSYNFHEVIYVSLLWERSLKIWLAIGDFIDQNECFVLATAKSYIEFQNHV